jgi:putative toxin-antitoxin system antitoxin component (TIGR02293 family)
MRADTEDNAGSGTDALIIKALGGPKVLKARTIEELRPRLREGLPFASFPAVSSSLQIDRGNLTRLLNLPTRTLARRKRAQRLGFDESDRLFRVARVGALAAETLGAWEKAVRWLHQPNRALGGEIPLRQLDTDLGAHQVEELLLRIQHGIYS